MNLLNMLDSGARADSAIAMQKSGMASNAATAGSSATLGRYNADVMNSMVGWQGEMDRNSQMSNMLGDTATGLSFLYGFGGGSKGGGAGSITKKGSRFAPSGGGNWGVGSYTGSLRT